MTRLLIIGAGFAGMWAALAAARLRAEHEAAGRRIVVAVLAPEPVLHLRPRFYESDPEVMTAPLSALFATTGIDFISGRAETVDSRAREVRIRRDRDSAVMAYDRLVIAAGSQLHRPDVPGLDRFAFSVDQLADVKALHTHLRSLQPGRTGRACVVVVGAGFTGIEVAAEMPQRLRDMLDDAGPVRVVLVERAPDIGPELGKGPRPVISEALRDLGVEVRLGAAVESVDADGVVLGSGERIEAATVIWTGGMRASPLTEQIESERDALGRLVVDTDLRVPGVPDVFVAGDSCVAATDKLGNRTLMSCQHALRLGRFAGHNAMADLLRLPTIPYAQPVYTTTLDLGPWGAVQCRGWDREVFRAGMAAKPVKHHINTKVIYPPSSRDEAFLTADPLYRADARPTG